MSIEDNLYKFLKLYKNLPLPIKNLLGALYKMLPKKLRYGSFYFEYTKRIEEKNRINYLENHLALMSEKAPFYKAINSKNIIDFPIINKSIIKENYNDFLNPANNNRLLANTGGSSGTPFEFFLEKGVSRPKERAQFDWYWKKFGYTHKDKILMIRGEALPNNKLYEYQMIENRLAISCYLVNNENIGKVIKAINEFKPSFIHAYPSALKNFMDNVKNREKLKVDIKAIFLGSEGLIDSDRKEFKSFFKADVSHWYGHSERLIHAGNCPYSDEFHIFDFYGYVELVDENNKVINDPGIKGRIIATGYDNSVMPLIRYDTGDEAEYSEKKICKCGFKGRSFKIIHGRTQDYIYLVDKTKVSLTAFIFGQHFEEFSLIKELQIIQYKYGEITLKIVLNDRDIFDSNKFLHKLKTSVDNKLSINLKFVDFIEKTSRGKHVFLRQRIRE